MMLLKRYLRLELNTLLKNNIRFRTIGRTDELSPDVQDELAMGMLVRPTARAETEERVGGGADVGVGHEAERRLVAQLGADVGPLAEDGDDDEERNRGGGDDEHGAVRSGEECADLRFVQERDGHTV